MNPDEVVAQRFNELIALDVAGREHEFSQADRAIYSLVATRCEIDMEGFESAFEQLLTDTRLRELITSLELIGEPELARDFQEVGRILREHGFVIGVGNSLDQAAPAALDAVARLGERIQAGQRLWSIDDRLEKLMVG